MNIKTRLVDDFDDLKNNGDYMFSVDMKRLLIVIPNCGIIGLPIGPSEPHPRWLFSGTRECPTLTPSIRCLAPNQWHGFLTNGELRPC